MSAASLHIDENPIQHIPPSEKERYEGLAISNSGILAVATAESNEILLFRPASNGRFEDEPYQRLGNSASKIDYPHDVSFSTIAGEKLLAVALRSGAILIFETDGPGDVYRETPSFKIEGKKSQLHYTDGVAFVPPNDDYIAACNGMNGTITFYRLLSRAPLRFAIAPELVMKDDSLALPDGIGFTSCGQWLVSANHNNNCFSIFQRRKRFLSRKLKFSSKPVSVMSDDDIRHPHSAVFTPGCNHVLGTTAGSNFFVAYESRKGENGVTWADRPVARIVTDEAEAFRAINANNKMEGGPKGIVAGRDKIVVCSPEFGIKVYAYRERQV